MSRTYGQLCAEAGAVAARARQLPRGTPLTIGGEATTAGRLIDSGALAAPCNAPPEELPPPEVEAAARSYIADVSQALSASGPYGARVGWVADAGIGVACAVVGALLARWWMRGAA